MKRVLSSFFVFSSLTAAFAEELPINCLEINKTIPMDLSHQCTSPMDPTFILCLGAEEGFFKFYAGQIEIDPDEGPLMGHVASHTFYEEPKKLSKPERLRYKFEESGRVVSYVFETIHQLTFSPKNMERIHFYHKNYFKFDHQNEPNNNLMYDFNLDCQKL